MKRASSHLKHCCLNSQIHWLEMFANAISTRLFRQNIASCKGKCYPHRFSSYSDWELNLIFFHILIFSRSKLLTNLQIDLIIHYLMFF